MADNRARGTDPRGNGPGGTGTRRELDLDEALEETFPSSDPIASSPRRAGRTDRVEHPNMPEHELSLWRQLFGRIKHKLMH